MIFDVIVIGAGAAGLMCAAKAGARGKRVLVLEKANKPGKKILMSGGGRCNFTNLDTNFDNYLSHNPHFCKSALSRYSQWDFIALVESYGIAYYEKTLGQLFCKDKAQVIVDMLLSECNKAKVKINYQQALTQVEKTATGFSLLVGKQRYACKKLVIASGGLSIPTLGGSPFGYELAKQFGLKVYPTRAGLVPYTLHQQDKTRFSDLVGISALADVSVNGQSFRENILFTHRGISGPAILQISSYWQAGQQVEINLLPQYVLADFIASARQDNPEQRLKTLLANHLAKKILEVFVKQSLLDKPLKQLEAKDIDALTHMLQQWQLTPNATEGYRTAEVTLGGVDTDELSSKTFEAKNVSGLYFIGEVLDVTGWLGGYNFQWAWASAHACSLAV